jgi:hypothetical protein
MRKTIITLGAIAIQSVVTYFYFTFFGVSWYSVIPFFVWVQLLKTQMTENG